MKKVLFYFILYLTNKFLKGNRFFNIKRNTFNLIGIEVGKGTKIVGPINISYVNNIKIGNECWIGKNFTVDGNGTVIIEHRCDLAPNVLINTGGHEIGNERRRAGSGKICNTKIKSGSWIGTNVIIINGAEIGESVVVAAGSVVTKNVAPNTLVAGVPAVEKKLLSRGSYDSK